MLSFFPKTFVPFDILFAPVVQKMLAHCKLVRSSQLKFVWYFSTTLLALHIGYFSLLTIWSLHLLANTPHFRTPLYKAHFFD